MSAPYSDVFSKLTQAAAALIVGNVPYPVTVYQGENNQQINVPCVRLYARNSGEEDPQFSGNFWANFDVEVIYPAPIQAAADGAGDTLPPNDDLVKYIVDIFMSQTIETDLNQCLITDFTVIGSRERNISFEPSGDQWINSLTMQLLVCPSTLYP